MTPHANPMRWKLANIIFLSRSDHFMYFLTKTFWEHDHPPPPTKLLLLCSPHFRGGCMWYPCMFLCHSWKVTMSFQTFSHVTWLTFSNNSSDNVHNNLRLSARYWRELQPDSPTYARFPNLLYTAELCI